jgi:nitroreductase
MSFMNLAETRQSCRNYDPAREVEADKLERILETARLSPSACNGQPYHITVCRGEAAKMAAKAVQGMGMNKFADNAPVMLVISDEPYVKTAAFGSKLKGIDYRSIDMGILAAYITAAATEEGLGSCIIGSLDRKDVKEILGVGDDLDLMYLIALGYHDTTCSAYDADDNIKYHMEAPGDFVVPKRTLDSIVICKK